MQGWLTRISSPLNLQLTVSWQVQCKNTPTGRQCVCLDIVKGMQRYS